jgi:hypothetical protein
MVGAALELVVAEARVAGAGTGSRRRRGRWPAVELPAATALNLDRLGLPGINFFSQFT